jgi:c-di-GMP-binding flagellar brake protein YcgR
VLRGTSVDISSGGLLFRTDGSNHAVADGAAVVVEIEKIGTVDSSVIAKSPSEIHLQFENMPDETRQRVSDFIRSVEQVDQKFISAA